MPIEDRIIAIETKVDFHEDLVQTLNNTVFQQQQRISALEDQLKNLAQRMVVLGQSSSEPADHLERPPHY